MKRSLALICSCWRSVNHRDTISNAWSSQVCITIVSSLLQMICYTNLLVISQLFGYLLEMFRSITYLQILGSIFPTSCRGFQKCINTYIPYNFKNKYVAWPKVCKPFYDTLNGAKLLTETVKQKIINLKNTVSMRKCMQSSVMSVDEALLTSNTNNKKHICLGQKIKVISNWGERTKDL